MKITTVVFCILTAVQMVLAAAIVIWNEVDPNFYFAKYFMGEATAEFCTYIIFCAFVMGILIKFYKIFHLASIDGRPFSKSIATKIKSIGVTILVASVVVPLVEKMLLMRYAEKSFATAVSSIAAPLPFVMLAIVFFFFSVLFSYGAELQQQSDETL